MKPSMKNRLSKWRGKWPGKTKLLSLGVLAPAVFVAAAIAAALLVASKPQARAGGGDAPARAVSVVQARLGAFSPVLPIYARVTTPRHARLSAALAADVRVIHAQAGQSVRRGDTLIELDDREAALLVQQRRADVLEARAALEAELLRHENELFVIRGDSGAAARRNREQIIRGHEISMRGLEARLLRAEAALARAELDLQRAVITAPFDGRVTTAHVAPGDRVRVGDRLIDLFDRRALELTGSIPRRYQAAIAAALDEGARLVAVSTDGGPRLRAVLSRLQAQVNPASGGVDAIFTILQGDEDAGYQIHLGRSLRLRLELPPVAGSFVAPNTALYGADTVYRVVGSGEEQRLQAVTVKRLGDWADGLTDGLVGDEAPGQARGAAAAPRSALLLSDSIKDGDIILATQLPNAIENLPVKPTPAAARLDAASDADRG